MGLEDTGQRDPAAQDTGTIIYTTVFNNYDLLIPASSPGERICFTENPIQSRGWDVRLVERKFDNPWLENRYYKALAHVQFPNVDYSIYHDATVGLRVEPEILLDFLGDNDLAVFPHFGHADIYDEADAYIRIGKTSAEEINRQIDPYQADDYPDGFGFHACTVIVRKHTDAVRAFNEYWWQEIQKYDARPDQISFAYTRWKTGLKVGLIPFDLWPTRFSSNEMFFRTKHIGQ